MRGPDRPTRGGPIASHALHTVAELGIPDLFGDTPRPIHEIATEIPAEPYALPDIFRLLADHGLFAETRMLAPGTAAITMAATLDLVMVLLLGGRERTQQD